MQTRPVPEADFLTVASIGLLAYMLGNLLHEGAGHGGACLIVGAKPALLSSVAFDCSADSRLVDAGGTLINFLAAAVFFALGRLTTNDSPHWKYFLWIAMTANLYAATGYFLFSGIGGIGDWAAFIQGLGPQWMWRIGLAIFGAVTYLLASILTVRELRPLIGSDKEQRYLRAIRLSFIPYFCGGILMCIAGAGNPNGMILILISAAASTFGGTSALLWAHNWLHSERLAPCGPASEPPAISRSWPLVTAAGAAAIAFVAVLGPGVRFAH